MKRKMIERKCIDCHQIAIVRADGAGIRCSPCRARENSKNQKPKDLKNKTFGKLTILSLSHINESAYWNCKCSCGNKCVIQGTRMTTGKTKSCGCIIRTRNGRSKSPSFLSWKAMIQRCYDKSVSHYKRYGEKGITVCERWINSFDDFVLDMGKRPEGKTLDRIDSNGNYEPKNCRWVSLKEQANNTKSNFRITCFGKTQTLTQWAEEYKIRWSTLRKRIVDLNWNVEKAILTPVGKYAS